MAEELAVEKLVEEAARAVVTRSSVAELAQAAAEADLLRALRAAVAKSESRGALVLSLALAARGVRLDRELVRAVLLDAPPNTKILCAILSVCDGDRVALLLECADNGGLDRFQQVAFLVVARRLMGEAKPPRRFYGRLRALARDEFDPWMLGQLAVAARGSDAADLQGPAQFLLHDSEEIDRVIEGLDAALAGSVLDSLPSRPPSRVAVGHTFVRTSAKVGRNDPCPCGSGKKFKKCCEGKSSGEVRAASVREQFEQLSGHSEGIRRHLFDQLGPADLARLDPSRLSTLQVIGGMRRLFARQRWEAGERYLEELGKRADLASDVADYHADLVHEAMAAGAVEVAERHVDRAALDAEWRAQFLLGRSIKRRTIDAIDHLEQVARQSLAGEIDGLIGMAHTVLPHYPAVGILFARAALDPARRLDSECLLESMEEARDQLDIDPYEPWWTYFDDITGRADDRDRHSGLEAERLALESRLDELRAGLRESQMRVSGLASELKRREADLEAAARQRDDLAARPMAQPDAAGDEERRRLRNRIAELKGLIAEGSSERAGLRAELTALARDRDKTAGIVAAPAGGEESQGEGPIDAEDWPRRLLIPEYSRSARSSLAALPRRVANEALVTVAALAGGEASAWRSVKKMRRTRDLYSTRCGREYRILFRFEDESLSCEAIIHRRDLDATLDSLA
jgi:hypothetical protein